MDSFFAIFHLFYFKWNNECEEIINKIIFSTKIAEDGIKFVIWSKNSQASKISKNLIKAK